MFPIPFLRDTLQIDRTVLIRALVMGLAAWVAFAVAATHHVQNAYWAAMPIWVVAQASRGLMIERAVWRILGTLLGAAAGFAILHIPIPPLAQLALLGLWVGVNGGLIHLLRGVTSYGALLSGMTAAVIVIPTVLSPGDTLDLALARLECTLIGVVTVTLITGFATPASPRAAFYERARRLGADALAFAALALRRNGKADMAAEARILGALAELESSGPMILAGSLDGYRRRHSVDSLVVGSLSAMSAALDPNIPAETAERTAAALAAAAEGLRSGRIHHPDQPATPQTQRLTEALRRILSAGESLSAPVAPERPGEDAEEVSLPTNREWPLALWTAALTGLACFTASALGMTTGWMPLILAALGVSIFSLVLGSLPQPQLIAPGMIKGVSVGAVAGTLYRLGLQEVPPEWSTPVLLATLVPILLLSGVLRASPRTAIPAIDANMCFLLSSQAGASAMVSASTAIVDGLMLVAASLLMAGGFLLMPRKPMRQAENAAMLIRRDLRRMLRPLPEDRAREWHGETSRQILRLALHLGRSKSLAERWPGGVLAVLNLGHVMDQLHQLPLAENSDAAAIRGAVLDVLGRFSDDPAAAVARIHALSGDAAAGPELGPLLVTMAALLDQSLPLLTFAG